ncbi:porin [Bacteroides sp. 224]|uniref:porin n=1 Tax=Bacteroides sp. 224 TaxID=2302936 RepID=UPI0013D79B4F|nr:porin [Bacteroides sp. 224]NDV64849.1 porin [Bacteroides sp. 224]
MKRILFLLVCCVALSTVSAQETEETKADINKVVNTLKERIRLMGYAQVGYTYNDADEADNNFDIKRIILMAEGKITKEWSLYFMYNFNSGGNLLEMYTDYHFLPGLSARLGQFKIPYTIESPLSTTVVELIDCYSQATNYLAAIGGSHDPLRGSTGGRDLGFMLYGDLFEKKLTYNIGAFNGQGINNKDKNSQKDFVGNLMVRPLTWLSLGGSYIKGKGHAIGTSIVNPDIKIGDNYTRDRWAVGTVIETKPISIRSEYLGGKDNKVKSDGYYVTASYHVAPKLDIIASYDYLNKNKDMSYKQTNYVAGVQYWFYPRCRVQAQYTYKDSKFEGYANMIQAQIQVRF